MAQEGISTLPQSPENAPQSFEQVLTSSKDELRKMYPEEAPVYDQGIEQIVQQLNLPLEELTVLKQILEYLLKNEKQYPQLRERLINEAGVRPEDIPEEFDRGYLMTMLVVVQEAIDRSQGQSMGGSMPEPQGFNKGGLAAAAEALRQKGRGGDTILAHINPQEAQLLKAMGGSGTINPATGLLEFKGNPLKAIGNAVSGIGKAVGSAFSAVGNAVKSVVSSPVGKILATVALTAVLGPGGLAIGGTLGAGAGLAATAMAYAIPAAIAGSAISLAGGSNLSTALKTGLISGGLAGLAPGLSNFLPGSGGYLNAAATGAILGGGYGALTGQNIGTSALTGGLLAGGLSAAGGAGATGPGQAGQTGIFSPKSPAEPAPITDYSQPLTPSAEGISTLPSGQTNLQAPTSRPGAFDYTPSGEMVPSNYSPQITGAQTTTAPSGTTAAMAAPTGAVPSPTSAAPTAPQQSSGIGGYLDKAKDYLFSSDPKNPGFFYNDKGQISIPAVTGTVLAGGALMGGFETAPVTPPGIVNPNYTGENLIAENPSKYLVGGLPGSTTTTPGTTTPTNISQNVLAPSPIYGAPRSTPYPTYVPPPSIPPVTINSNIYNPYGVRPMYAATGGITRAYPRKNGAINGPGTETSDSIPAMLSDGEFVLTAKAVRGAGGGSRREGAKKLYRMMHALEKKAGGKV